NANVQASLGQQGGNQDEGFVGTSRTQLDSGEGNVMASLRARIEAFLSRAGVMSTAPDTGASIVVTDTPEVLNRIAVYLEQENRALTRRVRLVFEELVVQAHDNAEAGLNWELI